MPSNCKYMEIRDWLVMKSPVICPRCYTINRGVSVGHTKILKNVVEAAIAGTLVTDREPTKGDVFRLVREAGTIAGKLGMSFDFTFRCDETGQIEKVDGSCTHYSKS